MDSDGGGSSSAAGGVSGGSSRSARPDGRICGSRSWTLRSGRRGESPGLGDTRPAAPPPMYGDVAGVPSAGAGGGPVIAASGERLCSRAGSSSVGGVSGFCRRSAISSHMVVPTPARDLTPSRPPEILTTGAVSAVGEASDGLFRHNARPRPLPLPPWRSPTAVCSVSKEKTGRSARQPRRGSEATARDQFSRRTCAASARLAFNRPAEQLVGPHRNGTSALQSRRT